MRFFGGAVIACSVSGGWMMAAVATSIPPELFHLDHEVEGFAAARVTAIASDRIVQRDNSEAVERFALSESPIVIGAQVEFEQNVGQIDSVFEIADTEVDDTRFITVTGQITNANELASQSSFAERFIVAEILFDYELLITSLVAVDFEIGVLVDSETVGAEFEVFLINDSTTEDLRFAGQGEYQRGIFGRLTPGETTVAIRVGSLSELVWDSDQGRLEFGGEPISLSVTVELSPRIDDEIMMPEMTVQPSSFNHLDVEVSGLIPRINYQLESSSDLSPGSWVPVRSVQSSSGSSDFLMNGLGASESIFYRLRPVIGD